MAHLPVIADTYRCAFRWLSSGGQSAVNVIHIRDVGTGHTRLDAWNAINASVGPLMWQTASDQSAITAVDITPLDGITATETFLTGSGANWTGGGGDDFTPQNAVIIKLTTEKRGRSHRGRVFIPFTSEDRCSDGIVTPAVVATLTTEWGDFANDLAEQAVPFQLVVASYKLATAELVTGVTCESLCATQRRRQSRLRSS